MRGRSKASGAGGVVLGVGGAHVQAAAVTAEHLSLLRRWRTMGWWATSSRLCRSWMQRLPS